MQEEMKRKGKNNLEINISEVCFIKQFWNSLMEIKIHVELRCMTTVAEKSGKLKWKVF